MRVVMVIAILMTIAIAANAQAQTALELKVGDRLKIYTSEGNKTIHILGADESSIEYRTKGNEFSSIKISDITKLSIPYPRTRWRAVWTRSLGGMAGGGIAGAVVGFSMAEDEFFKDADSLKTGSFVMGLLFGACTGCISGLICPGTSWETVELPVRINVQNGNVKGVSVGLSCSF